MSHVLRHLVVLTVSQESISLIDEQNDTILLLLSPVEQLVEFSYGHWAQWSDITADHDCVLKATLESELLSEEGLTSTWRTIKHQVLCRCVMLLTVKYGIGDLTKLIFKILLKDDTIKKILLCSSQALMNHLLHVEIGK